MQPQQEQLTRNQRILLIIVGILAIIGLIVYIVTFFLPHNEDTSTNAVTTTDSASHQKVTVGGDVKSSVSGASDTAPTFIGFDDMSGCGMTQYNITAMRTALQAYAPFNKTIINLYTDSLELTYDTKSNNPPQCTFKIKVNPAKSYPNDPSEYTVVDTLDSINTAHVILKSHGSTVFSSPVVTAN